MNILDRIIADKYKEVELRKRVIFPRTLEASPLFELKTLSLVNALNKSTTGIIGEHKRRSPSKNIINQGHNVHDVAVGYAGAGVCGISVLTDAKYFGGSMDDLILARASVEIPILRKEFIVDEYQLLEAKAHGADVILLIASVLSRERIKRLSQFAKSLNLEVLLEVHNIEELEKSIMPGIDMMGVNNRNLKTFEVSTQISKDLSQKIPEEFLKVSESGISSIDSIRDLMEYGYKGFLIGENFMKGDNPGKSATDFISQLNLKK